MRTRYALLVLLSFFMLSDTNACVDYWTPPSVTVTVELDVDHTQALITVSNLSLFGGPNGAFCSCAITTWTDMFSDLQYVAFVDSGTYDPVPGFAAWDASTSASAAWNNVQTGDWYGYIAEVVGPGISTGTPVELLIRAALPLGSTFEGVDSTMTYTYLGTDEWSPSANDLAFSHNSLGSLGDAVITYEYRELDHFALVDGLVTSTPEPDEASTGRLVVYRNADDIFISLPLELKQVDLRIYDAVGRTVLQRSWGGEPLRFVGLSPGVFVVEVRSDTTRFVRRIPVG